MFLKRMISCQSFSIMWPRFYVIGLFSNHVVFDEIKWLYAFAEYITLNFITKPQSMMSVSWF